MKKQKFGLSDEVIQSLKSVFQKHQAIEKVLIYGSRAKGNFRPGSDIDLTLIGQQLTTTDLLKIENEIDDLLLEYKIDLSLQKQIDDPNVIDHIQRVGIAIYSKD